MDLEDAVVDGLRELARARHVVLDSDDRILMAHPFAAIPRDPGEASDHPRRAGLTGPFCGL